jgi:hypothetical protein
VIEHIWRLIEPRGLLVRRGGSIGPSRQGDNFHIFDNHIASLALSLKRSVDYFLDST